MSRSWIVRSTLLAVALLGATAFARTGVSAPAAPAEQLVRVHVGPQDFTLVNKTGLTIMEVYVSPSEADDWEEDVMGKDVLDDGESVDITFDRKETAAKWDLKVVTDKKQSYEWGSLNLLKIEKVTIKLEKGKPVAYTE